MDPIILPILCHTDDTMLMKDLGIDNKIDDYNVAEFVFFKIDFACRSTKYGRELTEINIGDSSFIADLPFDEFIQVINE